MKYNNYFKIDVALLMLSIWSYVMSNAWMCIPYAVAFWVVRKIVTAFLGAAFGGKMRL